MMSYIKEHYVSMMSYIKEHYVSMMSYIKEHYVIMMSCIMGNSAEIMPRGGRTYIIATIVVLR